MTVVVTGLGIVSSVGQTIHTAWNNITAGISGMRPVPPGQYQVSRSTKTGHIADFVLDQCFDRRWINKTDRHVQLALNATQQAVAHSGLDLSAEHMSRVHTVVGTCAGGYDSIAKNIARTNEGDPSLPNFIPGHINNMMSAYINMHYGIQGSGLCVAGACAAGNQAIAVAAMLIETGQADVVITGASDSWLHDVVVSGFESLGALSFDDQLPRPFDQNRSGFAISEGAGILILESEQHARNRRANILAKVSGYGFSSDAYHPTSPEPSGAVVESMIRAALGRAGLNVSDIDYINAHATGTVIGDRVECQTLFRVFGADPLLGSTKSMTGHSIGSSSAIEAVISVMALTNGAVPGTVNLDQVDPQCPGNHLRQSIDHPVFHVLSNSFGFGGTNGVVIFSRFDQ
jgi:3-oxoacyl-[acyl-carrier-protein] synthase II